MFLKHHLSRFEWSFLQPKELSVPSEIRLLRSLSGNFEIGSQDMNSLHALLYFLHYSEKVQEVRMAQSPNKYDKRSEPFFFSTNENALTLKTYESLSAEDKETNRHYMSLLTVCEKSHFHFRQIERKWYLNYFNFGTSLYLTTANTVFIKQWYTLSARWICVTSTAIAIKSSAHSDHAWVTMSSERWYFEKLYEMSIANDRITLLYMHWWESWV